MADAMVHGFTHDRYAPVRAAFEDTLASGQETGGSCCVTVDGQTVVDLWGGFADADRTRPWHRDTIVNVYSATKTMTALVVLLLADRGELDVDAPVARYWPQFAANGKDRITIAQVMSHTAGLAVWAEPVVVEDLYDWEKVTGLLAAQAPLWQPGTVSGYHAVTQGYLAGEVVRRITGRSLGTVFREEIAGPLDADFHIGLPASQDARVADLIAPVGGPPFGPDPGDLTLRVATNPAVDPAVTRTRAWRGAEIPAGGGTGNARSMAEIQAVLANGGVAGGRRLLTADGCRRVLDVRVEGRDLVLDLPLRFGLGFAVAGGMMPNPATVYWGGYGGSLVIVDLDARMSFAYAGARMGGVRDFRAFGIAMAMWKAAGLL